MREDEINMKVFNARVFALFLAVSMCLLMLPAAYAEGPGSGNAELIELTGNGAKFSCSGVSAEGSIITISKAGNYVLRGTLDNGRIIVNTGLSQEKLYLTLDGVSITCLTDPAIYIAQAKKARIYMTEGTENVITSGTEELLAVFDDSHSGAALYSEDDLDIRGPGKLMINGYINNGITCKDDFDMEDGILEIFSANNGIKGSESVEIKAGKLIITCGNDGLKATSSKAGKGFVAILGGTVSLSCGGDGISAFTDVTVSGGDTEIISEKTPIKAGGEIYHTGGSLIRNGE